MALNKKKRIKEWCSGGGEALTIEWSKESRKLCLTPDKRKTKYARCKICNQRFEIYNRECDDLGCIHMSIPKHKAY